MISFMWKNYAFGTLQVWYSKKMPHGSRKILTQRPKAGRKASKDEGKVLVFKS